MPTLSSNPDLKAIQEYVSQLEFERGFDGNTVQQACLLLGEEVGELFKAVRKQQKMRLDQKSSVGTVEEELADILIYVCSIANRLGIELEQAFRDKEELNKRRAWVSRPDTDKTE
ncbi:MazG nucleotide pyrophosphohydrolase domain-containing protein [Nocardia sp. NPDC003482]